jgi:chromosome segregation ATPase
MKGEEQPFEPPRSEESVTPPEPPDQRAPSPEDLLCLQSVIDELRRERESLIRRLQSAESSAREKLQLSESRLREALAQVEALKRSTQSVRTRSEAEAQAAKKRADHAEEGLGQIVAEAERLQVENAELTTALEATQCRLADLETESGVHQAEIERLQKEHDADADRVNELTARVDELQQQALEQTRAAESAALRQEELAQLLASVRAQQQVGEAAIRDLESERERLQLAWRQADERFEAEAHRRIELERTVQTARSAHEDELRLWHEAAGQREAELVSARDELARQLEQEQSSLGAAREETSTLSQRVRTIEAELAATHDEKHELRQEVAAVRDEIERERSVFEAAARQREEDHRVALDAARAGFESEREELLVRLAAQERERERLAQRVDEIEQNTAAVIADQQQAQTELEAEFERERRALTDRIAALEAELHERDQRLEAARNEAHEVRRQRAAESADAEGQAREREQHWQSLRSQWEAEVADLRQQLSSADEAVAATRAQVDAREQELQKRLSEVGALSVQAGSLTESLSDRERVIEQLQRELEGARAQHASERETFSASAESQQQQWREMERGLHAEIAQAREDLGKREISIEAVRTQVRALEAQLAERDTVRTALSQRVTALEVELQERDQRIERLTADRTSLERKQLEEIDFTRREAELIEARDQLTRELAEERERGADAEQEIAAQRGRIRELEQLALEVQSSAEENGRQVQEAVQQELETARRQVHDLMQRLSAAQLGEGEAQRRADELARHLEELQEQTVSALQAQEVMAARIEDLDTEKRELALRLDQMTALTSQLERESERLRRERAAPAGALRQKAELARVEAKISELEQQHGEAVQRHSAAVAGYMMELNQRSDALQARNLEVQKLTEELAITVQACEDAVTQLESLREEKNELEQQLLELRAVTASASRAAPNGDDRGKPAAARAHAKPAQAGQPAASARPAGVAARSAPPSGPITIIHLEENKSFREPVRELASRLPDSSYLNTADVDSPPHGGPRMLAVNLLNRAHDPVAVIASSIATDEEHAEVFAYCADGAFGFSFGVADFFAPPIDPDGCVTRLLERRGAVQRLLAVSEDVEMTGALREVLSRVKCSTSVAFDVRQAIDLLPMIKPDVVLVDFSLPRGEGLRLVSRMRADPKTRDLPLAILLPAAAIVPEFRQHAVRATRESPMSPAQLAEALGRRLGVAAAGTEESARIAQAG